ncbi:MAG TPA: glycosyltransferase family 2 protein [Spirochaetota bacterium]|nr:glycosyltransferase family 2 protein [Spirochaetota bacterium]
MISIALAVYNGGNYIRNQLESYKNQVRKPDELVVSDDASTDDTISIVKNFAESSPFKIKILNNKNRLGMTKNFERAIQGCSGDIIFLSDHDDVWHKDKILKLASSLENNSKAALVHCNAYIVNENLKDTGNKLWESFWFSKREQQKVKSGKAFDVYLKHSVAAGMSMAFKSSLLDAILPIPHIHSIHDVWIALIAAAIADVNIIDDPLLYYRVHNDNQSVGINKRSLKEQFYIAKKQAKDNTFENLESLYQLLLERLFFLSKSGDYHISNYILSKVKDRLTHAKFRNNISKTKGFKAFTMIPEIINGNYFRFSYGMKSISQDLILR